MLRQNFLFGILLACAVITAAFVSCNHNSEFSRKTDNSPPSVHINYPPAESIIRNSFVLKGTSKDDTGIQSVTAKIKYKGLLLEDLPAKLTGNSWSVVLNKPTEDGLFPMKDGKYEVIVTAEDSAGKKSSVSSSYYIDNTPPVLVLDRPYSTNKSIDNIDIFGNDFRIIGESADDSGVSMLKVYGYNTKTGSAKVKSTDNIGQMINLKIDEFTCGEPDDFYKGLYGTERYAGMKSFLCGFELFDNAKEYESPDTNGNPEAGNKTCTYYLRTPLTGEHNVFPYYSVSDIYKMMSGAYYTDEQTGEENALNKEEAMLIVRGLKEGFQSNPLHNFSVTLPNEPENPISAEYRNTIGNFGLNPVLSPTYHVDGLELIPVNSKLGDKLYQKFELPKEAILTIKLSQGGSGAKLQIPTDANGQSNYGFYVCDFYEYQTAVRTYDPNSPDFISKNGVQKLNIISVASEDGGYTFKASLEGGFEEGKVYVFLASGQDQKGNTLIPAFKNNEIHAELNEGEQVPISVYGFKIEGNSFEPKIRIYGINERKESKENNIISPVSIGKDDDILISGVIDSANEDFILTVSSENLPNLDDIAINYDSANGDFDFVIPNEKLNGMKSVSYSIKICADNGDLHFERICIINYDIEAPLISVKTPAERSFWDRNVLIMEGTLADSLSGVKDKELAYTLENSSGKIIKKGMISVHGVNWSSEEILLPEEGKYKAVFNFEDNAKNKGTFTLPFVYDAGTPEISEVTIGGFSAPEVYINKAFDIKIKAADTLISDGVFRKNPEAIEKVEIRFENLLDTPFSKTWIWEKNSSISAINFDTSLKIWKLGSLKLEKDIPEGSYKVFITVIDSAGRQVSFENIRCILDSKAPIIKNIKIGSKDISDKGATESLINNIASIEGFFEDQGISSGAIYAEYQISHSVPAEDKWLKVNTESTVLSSGGYKGKFVWDQAFKSGEKLFIRIVDKCGNISPQWHCTLIGSAVPPSAVITVNADKFGNSFFDSQTGTYYRKGGFEIEIETFDDKKVNEAMFRIKKDGKEISPSDCIAGGYNPLLLAGSARQKAKFFHKNNIKDGLYEYSLELKDNDYPSLTGSTAWSVVVDNTPPVFSSIKNGSDDLTHKQSIFTAGSKLLLQVEMDDSLSGIKSLEWTNNNSENISGSDVWNWMPLGCGNEVKAALNFQEEGAFLHLKAIDKSGNAAFWSVKVNNDVRPPIAEIKLEDSYPQNGIHFINEEKNIIFTVKDDIKVENINLELSYTPSGSSVQEAYTAIYCDYLDKQDTLTARLTGWNASLLKPENGSERSLYFVHPRDEGVYKYTFKAYDAAGQGSKEAVLIVAVDKTAPAISVTSHKWGDSINKIVMVKGCCSDEVLLKTLTVKDDRGKVMRMFEGDAACAWTIPINTLYSYGSESIPVVFTFEVEDFAGNISTENLLLKTDQDSDRPKIIITNLQGPVSSNTKQPSKLMNNILTGVVEDDDGIIRKIEISENANFSEAKVFLNTKSWEYTCKPIQQKVLYFRITDNKGGVFVTSYLDDVSCPIIFSKMNKSITTSEPIVVLFANIQAKKPVSKSKRIISKNSPTGGGGGAPLFKA